jgi:hypothetical protein
VDMNLQSTLVVVLLYTEAGIEPAVSCLLRGISCQWCLVITDVVAKA